LRKPSKAPASLSVPKGRCGSCRKSEPPGGFNSACGSAIVGNARKGFRPGHRAARAGSRNPGGVVSDRFALVLGTLILAGIALDLLANDGGALLFLMRKFSDLVEYLAFWR
jgi:hypothetical protein